MIYGLSFERAGNAKWLNQYSVLPWPLTPPVNLPCRYGEVFQPGTEGQEILWQRAIQHAAIWKKKCSVCQSHPDYYRWYLLFVFCNWNMPLRSRLAWLILCFLVNSQECNTPALRYETEWLKFTSCANFRAFQHHAWSWGYDPGLHQLLPG